MNQIDGSVEGRMSIALNCVAPGRPRQVVLAFAVIVLALVGALQRPSRAASTYEVFHAFSGENGSSFGALVEGPDGRLYGTTHQGGTQGRGSIVAAVPQPGGGLAVTTVHEFSGPDGSNIYGDLVVGIDGRLYGTSAAGGANGMGTIYAFSPTAGFEALHSVDSSALSGLYMGLVAASDGLLYGVSGNGGRVFQISPSGDLTVVATLESSTTGANPRGALIEGVNGDLYGTTVTGGPNGAGTVFRVTKTGVLTRVHGFSSAEGQPWGGVMEASDGYLYGTTLNGGTYGGGVVYRVGSAGDFQILHHFISASGTAPKGRLLQATDGLLYGTTRNGGAQNRGVIFRIGQAGTPSYSVVQSIVHEVGQNPEAGLVQTSSGDFYGTTVEVASVPAAIFWMPPSGASLARVHTFSRSLARSPFGGLTADSAGSLFGTTSEGGSDGWGTIFRVSSSGTFSVLRSFSYSSGARPDAKPVFGQDGWLYGTAAVGGSGGQGVVYRIASDGSGYTVLHSFTGSTGSTPQARLAPASDGYLYGTTAHGGAHGFGTIFRISPAGSFDVVHSFAGGASGSEPRSELLQAADGFLYGTTADSSSAGRGTVFRLELSGAFTTLHAFTGPDGDTPWAGLVQAPDGYLYGVTQAGGTTNNAGAVYRVSPAGVVSGVTDFPQQALGVFPYGSLLLSRDGRLYGMAANGGANAGGTLFRINPSTGRLRVLHDFVAGSAPSASLIEPPGELALFGVAQGGPNNGGVVFRFTPDRAPVAVADAFATSEDAALTISAPGVLGNDSDDGGSITAALVSAPPSTEGTLTLASNGSFTFTPAPNFSGAATFSYKALDAADESDPVTVTITVAARNDAPVVSDSAVATAEDTNVSGAVSWSDLDDSSVTFRLAANGAKGTATIHPQAGTFVYVPNANAFGADAFTFVANDGDADSNVATVTVNISPVNDAPTAADDVVVTTEDATVLIQPLAGDADVDGDTLAITAFSRPQHGRLTQTAPDRFQFVPGGNFTGSDSFTYTIGDGSGLTGSATVRITVTPVNDAPAAHGQTLALVEDTARAIALSGADPDDNALTFRIVAAPAHGSLSGSAPALTYTPAGDYTGPDSFTFVSHDGLVDSAPATISLSIDSHAWVSGGPEGGKVNIIVTDPGAARIAYAGTDGAGIFKTSNGGATWVAVNGGLTSFAVEDIAIDPLNPNVVFAGTRSGLWKTTNAGGTWSRVPGLLPNLGVPRVAIDPANPAIAYAATGLGLFKTINSGSSWNPVNAGLTASGNITQLAIDPVTTTTIYAGTASGMFKSTDGASTWTAINAGLPASKNVIALSIAAHNPDTLLLSLAAFSQVYRSVDGGGTWSLSSQGLGTGVVRTFARTPAEPGLVYAHIFGRVYRSLDDGAMWAPFSSEIAPLEISTLAISPAAPATMLAGTLGAGAYRSADGGATWVGASSGLAASAVTSVAVDPHQASTLLAGNRGMGVTRSIDGGTSWQSRTAGVGNPVVFMVAADSGAAGTFYAATPGGLFKTTDDGGTWTFSGAGMPSNVQVVAVDPLGTGSLYAGTFSNGVYKSTNRGSTWSPINTGLSNLAIRALAIDPSNSATVYAGTNIGVFKSVDGGASWTAANAGLSNTVQALVVSPTAPAAVYAGTLSGLYRSSDGGATWARHGLNSAVIRGILLDAIDPASLMIAEGGGGVSRSRDGGQTWTSINSGLTSLTVSAIVATADVPRRIYVGTESGAFELLEAANDVPVATGQTVTVPEDTAAAVVLSGQDPDGQTLSFLVQSLPAHGTLSGVAPNLTYTPAPNYSGPDTFTFTVGDGTDQSAPASVTISVTPVNDAPVAEDLTVATAEDSAVGVVLAGSDGDGEPVTFDILTQPAHGTLSGAAPNLVYTPSANYNGTDSFTYRALDATTASGPATVSIAISPVNDTPVAQVQSLSTTEDIARPITLAATDVDGDALTYGIATAPLRGSLSGTAPNLTYTPLKDFNGADQFTFTVSDGNVSASAVVSVTVTGTNDPPVASVQTVLTVEDTPVAITLWGSDVEGDSLSFAIVVPPAHGAVSGTAPNLTYTPAANYRGADSFTFKVNDGLTDSAAAVVTISVTGEQFVPASPSGAIIDTIAVSPRNPDTVYAGGMRHLFRTTDGGATWTRSTANFQVSSLAIHPTSPTTIYAAGFGALRRSDDGGANWTVLGGPSSALGVVLDPSRPATLYTRSFSDTAVMKSTDGGTSWSPRFAGMQVQFGSQLIVTALEIDPRRPERLLAGVLNGGGLFRTTDGAASWQSVAFSGLNVSQIAFDPRGNSTVYAIVGGRIHRSVDAGDTWVNVNVSGSDQPVRLAVDPSGAVYAASASGAVFVSSSAGSMWTRFANPQAEGVRAVAAATPGTIYLAGLRNLLKSVDGAASWARAETGIVSLTATALLSSWEDPRVLFAATDQGVFKSADAGNSWGQLSLPPVGANGLNSLAQDPHAPGTVYLSANPGTLFKTTDGGTTWTTLNNVPTAGAIVYQLVVHPTTGVLYAASASGGVYKSVDRGLTWAQSGAGLPSSVYAVAASAAAPDILYASTQSAVYRSNDHGATWQLASSGLPLAEFRGLLVHPADPLTVYAAGQQAGLFKSVNGGNSWTRLNAAGGTGGVGDLAFDPRDPNAIYVNSHSSGGVVRSRDGGLTWQSLVAGLPLIDVRRMIVAADSTLYAAPWFAGIWRYATASNDVPQAESQAVTTDEDTTMAMSLSATDPDGEPLTFSVVTGPLHGTLSGTAPNLSYQPAPNYLGPDSFTFIASDGKDTSAPAVVTITVVPVNDAPEAAADALDTSEDTPLAFDPAALLGNDVDVEGATLSVVLAAGPAHGSLVTNPDGSMTYSPEPNYYGEDLFTYRASDGSLDSNTTTVSIRVRAVNDAPVGVGTALTIEEDTSGAGAVSVNDIDSPGLSYALLTDGSQGTAVVAEATSPSFIYVPAADATGSDTFIIGVSDGQYTTPVSVSVTITPVNDAPAATDGTLATDEDVVASGILAGSDIDSAGLTFTIVANGSKGSVAITDAATGAYTYTPALNANGADTFTFRVSDGELQSDLAIVAVSLTSVNDVPVAQDVATAAPKQTAIAGQLIATDIDGDPLSYALVQPPLQGTATLGADGSFTYLSAADASGIDRFTFKANDGTTDSAHAMVSVSILAPNGAPVAFDATLAVDEDTVANGTLQSAVQAGRSRTYTIVSNGSRGVATLIDALTGAFTYAPSANANGDDAFTFRVEDGVGTSNLATVSVTIASIDDAPIASPGSLAVTEERSESGMLIGTDVDGEALAFELATAPSKGVVTITNPDTGRYTYAPNANQTGLDSFSFKVRDAIGESNVAAVEVAIANVNDGPVAEDVSFTTTTTITLVARLPAADPDNDPLTFEIGRAPRRGTITGFNPATGDFSYTPDAGFSGQDAFTFRVNDGTRNSLLATVTIVVRP